LRLTPCFREFIFRKISQKIMRWTFLEVNMNAHKPSERGQALVLIVLGMVVMLGFTALAIDGGRLYTERRHAQNAADSASLSGALQKSNGQPDSEVLLAAKNSILSNGYQLDQSNVSIEGPLVDFAGRYYLIKVHITTDIQSAFAHFVYKGPLQNTVMAEAKVYESQPPMAGAAIVTTASTCDNGSPLMSITGGGNSGGINTYEGGIWLNARETVDSPCSIDPPTSANNDGITCEDPDNPDHCIQSVGSYSYDDGRVHGEDNISPRPVSIAMNGGVPIDDPLAGVPEPVCTGAGTVGSDPNDRRIDPPEPYEPGSFNARDIGPGIYSPGIYCINGTIHLSGDEQIIANGVVFYFINGGLEFTGNAGVTITAPTDENCLQGSNPDADFDPTASCSYKGMAIFSARDNTSTIEVRGNGADAIQGTVYALNGVVRARGGGEDPDETQIVGQVIANRVINAGNGSLKVTYDPEVCYWRSAKESLNQ
jgi:hypothetical protein